MSTRVRATTFRLRIPALAFGAALLVALAGSPARAQDQPSAEVGKSRPPRIFVIYKEEVKPGRTATHEKVEAAFAQAYSKMPGARPYVAMTSVTGPNEAWFMQGADNFKEIEAEMHATDNAPAAMKTQLQQLSGRETDEISSGRQIVAVYREDLSYKPYFDIPRMRYVEVYTFRVRAGHSNDIVDAAKLVMAAHDKANDGVQWAMYMVESGGEAGTFYAFRPVASLDKIDPTDTSTQMAYANALGDEGRKKLRELDDDGQIVVETAIFAFNPKMSYAPPAFAAADSFWAKPTQMASVGTSGKSSGAKTTAMKKPKK